jgi:hypothetical protein
MYDPGGKTNLPKNKARNTCGLCFFKLLCLDRSNHAGSMRLQIGVVA